MATAQVVYDFLVEYINKNGGVSRNWYAGIATDVEQRLFSDHNVDKQYGKWAHHTTDTENEARTVEKALLDLGCDGGSGGGDRPKTVYVYWKTPNTRE